MNATALLKKDHQTVTKLFHEYERLGDRAEQRKQELFERIRTELDTHASIEEEIFYPAVQEANEDNNDLVLEAREEHKVVKDLMNELAGMTPSDEAFDAKMKVLRENVEHHVEEEEGEMFPKAERQLREQRLNELGTAMETRRETLSLPVTTRIVRDVKTLIFGGEQKGGEGRSRGGSRGGRAAGKASASARSSGRKAAGGARKAAGAARQAGGKAAKGAKGAAAQARKRASGGGTRAKSTASRSRKTASSRGNAKSRQQNGQGRRGRGGAAARGRQAGSQQRGSSRKSGGGRAKASGKSRSSARRGR